MASFVTLTLDTTPPSLGVSLSEDLAGLATLALTSDDAFEVKVWGDIDVTWPGNADFAEEEADAPWIPFEEIIQLRLAGNKRIRVRVRDEVWNESAAVSRRIATDSPPPPVPHGEPAGGLPEAEPERRRPVREITLKPVVVRVGVAWQVTGTGKSSSLVRTISTTRVETDARTSRSAVPVEVGTRVGTLAVTRSRVRTRSTFSINREREQAASDNQQAETLLALDIL